MKKMVMLSLLVLPSLVFSDEDTPKIDKAAFGSPGGLSFPAPPSQSAPGSGNILAPGGISTPGRETQRMQNDIGEKARSMEKQLPELDRSGKVPEAATRGTGTGGAGTMRGP